MLKKFQNSMIFECHQKYSKVKCNNLVNNYSKYYQNQKITRIHLNPNLLLAHLAM